MNRTLRCRHGFALNIPTSAGIRCPVCAPLTIDREPHGKMQRARPSVSFHVGSVVAGVTVVDRVGDTITVVCGCGEQFDASRTAMATRARMGAVARCWRCRAMAAGTEQGAAAE